MFSVINMQDPAEAAIAAIGVLVVAVIAACYLSGKILNPSEEEASEEIITEPSRPRRHDPWGGFKKAHEDNPAHWPQNDSWNAEFVPR